MAPRRYLILTALTGSIIAASLTATGCCCPSLSGRYCDPGCCPQRASRCCCPLCIASCKPAGDPCCPSPCQPAECVPGEDPCPTAADANQVASCPDSADCPDPCRQAFPCCTRLSAWFAGLRHGVPSQQHPDYYSPPAKFHPVPTRPAFEPLPTYPPLLPADPGLNNPLRASTDRAPRPTVR